jgi:hypothetical protein
MNFPVVMGEELNLRFDEHPPKGDQAARIQKLREEAKALAVTIQALCPESREKALAFTNLEQTLMWAIAAIARRE